MLEEFRGKVNISELNSIATQRFNGLLGDIYEQISAFYLGLRFGAP
jgi:hypothetical protein